VDCGEDTSILGARTAEDAAGLDDTGDDNELFANDLDIDEPSGSEIGENTGLEIGEGVASTWEFCLAFTTLDSSLVNVGVEVRVGALEPLKTDKLVLFGVVGVLLATKLLGGDSDRNVGALETVVGDVAILLALLGIGLEASLGKIDELTLEGVE